MDEHDLLVIGSGSGLEVASVGANRGESVAVVEKGRLGGTCLNRGCIPSKMLLYRADVLETIERAGEFGIDAEVTDVAFREMVLGVNEDVHGEAEGIREGLTASPDHTLYDGEARFVDDRTIKIASGPDEGAHVKGDRVVVAAGTRPWLPDIDGVAEVDHLTSTDALQLEAPPEHLLVVGGGYVAAELAHFFGTFGSDVTIVGRRPHLLPQADEAVAAEFTDRYADRFTVHVGYEATAVREDGDEVTVEACPYDYETETAGEVDVTATGDELLVATGRTPNTDVLNVGAAGIETDADGYVETDEYLRTTAEGVWALGDIVGEYLLKHNANHEARTVARNMYGEDLEPVDYTAMPFAVFASPEVAGVGATEGGLDAAGREYATGTYRFEDTARGDAMHARGTVKVLVGLDGEILGCHVVGPDASTLIQEVVVAMKAGSGTVRDIREAVHVHPALPEVIQRAFLGQFTRGGHDGHHHHH